MSMLKPIRWQQGSRESQKLRCLPQVWHWLILCLRQVPKSTLSTMTPGLCSILKTSLKAPDLQLQVTWTTVETRIASLGWRRAHLDFSDFFLAPEEHWQIKCRCWAAPTEISVTMLVCQSPWEGALITSRFGMGNWSCAILKYLCSISRVNL